MKQPRRGEIYFLDSSPSKGKEMKGALPAHKMTEVDKAIKISLGLKEFWE